MRVPILRILLRVSVNSPSPSLPRISLILRYRFYFYFSVCMFVSVCMCRCACKFICVNVIWHMPQGACWSGAALSVGFHLPSCLETGSLARSPSAHHRLACPYIPKHYVFFTFHLPVGALRLQILRSLMLSFYLGSWDLNSRPHACTANTSHSFLPSLILCIFSPRPLPSFPGTVPQTILL